MNKIITLQLTNDDKLYISVNVILEIKQKKEFCIIYTNYNDENLNSEFFVTESVEEIIKMING